MTYFLTYLHMHLLNGSTAAEVVVEVEGEGRVRLQQLCHLVPPQEAKSGSLYPHMAPLLQELSWQWCCNGLPVHMARDEV